MARILYLMPGVGASPKEIVRRQELANSFLTNPAASTVTVDDTDEGPESIECSIEGDLSVRGVLKKLLKLRGTYDAVVVGCGDDPGLFSVRELLDVPVIGPMEASIAVAFTIGDRFSLITTGEASYPETRMILRRYGAEGRCASLHAVDCTVGDMIEGRISRAKLAEAFARQARLAIDQGASCITMGCMSMAFQLLDEAVRDLVAAPVINPAKVAIKMAEMYASLGIKHSPLAYPKPDFAKLRRTVLPEL